MKTILPIFIVATLLFSAQCKKDNTTIPASMIGHWVGSGRNLSISADGTWGSLTGSAITGLQRGGTYRVDTVQHTFTIMDNTCPVVYIYRLYTTGGKAMLDLSLQDKTNNCATNFLGVTYTKQ